MGTMSLKALPVYSSKWCTVLQTDSYKVYLVLEIDILLHEQQPKDLQTIAVDFDAEVLTL